MSKASDQITEYLSVGGLFNPETMNQTQHEAVRDTLINARDDIQQLERENAALREDKERLENYIAKQMHKLEVENTGQEAQIEQMETENVAMRADKARLDWLTNSLGWIIVGEPEADPSQHATEDGTLADAWRAAIDAARKEAQP